MLYPDELTDRYELVKLKTTILELLKRINFFGFRRSFTFSITDMLSNFVLYLMSIKFCNHISTGAHLIYQNKHIFILILDLMCRIIMSARHKWLYLYS